MSTTEGKNTLAQLMDVATLIDHELAQNGGELTPDMERILGLTSVLEAEKIDKIDYVIKRFEAESVLFKERASEYTLAARARANLAEKLRDHIKHLMLTHDRSELAGEYVRFVLSHSIPSLIIENEALIPKEFVQTITTEKIDNARVKEALRTGTPVEGAHLQESYQLRAYASVKKLGGR